MRNSFKLKDLVKADIQYPNLSIEEFSIGEKVFLKSNPETELTILYFDYPMNTIYTNGGDFFPHSLAKYNGNVIYKNHELNLN